MERSTRFALRRELASQVVSVLELDDRVTASLGVAVQGRGDPWIRWRLERHLAETHRQRRGLERRLVALHGPAALARNSRWTDSNLAEHLVAAVTADSPGTNARAAYAVEQLEVAAYEQLELLALKADDAETASIARMHARCDRTMARFIGANWDRVLDLILAQDGGAGG